MEPVRAVPGEYRFFLSSRIRARAAGAAGRAITNPSPSPRPYRAARKASGRRDPHTLNSFFKIPRSIFGDFQTTIFIGRLLSTLAYHVPRHSRAPLRSAAAKNGPRGPVPGPPRSLRKFSA